MKANVCFSEPKLLRSPATALAAAAAAAAATSSPTPAPPLPSMARGRAPAPAPAPRSPPQPQQGGSNMPLRDGRHPALARFARRQDSTEGKHAKPHRKEPPAVFPLPCVAKPSLVVN